MKLPPPMSGEELEVSYEGPAVHVNRFYIIVEEDGRLARIAFAEMHPEVAPVFRTAVLMTMENALALADLIRELAVQAPSGVKKG